MLNLLVDSYTVSKTQTATTKVDKLNFMNFYVSKKTVDRKEENYK